MPCSSVLSSAAAKKLVARIQELLNDGLSDSEIVRAIRREANTTHAWPDMSFSRIKKYISLVIEAEETSSDSESAPSFDSDEEDEEYVPPTEEESDDESDDDLVPEDEEDESEEDEEPKEIHNLTICFDRSQDGDDLDRLVITPQGDGLFSSELSYDLTSSSALPRRANFFEGDADSIDIYLGDILRLVALDELPFHSLEFAIPFFPNISVTPRSLRKKSVRKSIMNAIRQFLEHYEHA